MKAGDVCQERKTCRICGSDQLAPVIRLGEQYIASFFGQKKTGGWLDRAYPLELVRCAVPDGCGLVQLKHSISPNLLYNHYGYRSGINERMQQNLREIARETAEMAGLQPGDTVCDIGCNDGTLLESFPVAGIDRLGIDPAENVIAFARQKGLEVVGDFFSRLVYEAARPGVKAKIIATIAMFYDLEEPGGFVRDVSSVLADDGVWVMELAYLPFMLQNVSFDSICHEHLAYYCLRQLEWLLGKYGLQIHRLAFNDINGGSMRLFIRRKAAGDIPADARKTIAAVRESERALGLGTDEPYRRFYESALAVRRDLEALLKAIHDRGEKVYVYGASTKGNTLLQFCGIDHRLVPRAADRNPDKWSARTPATNIEIISEEQARQEAPDYFLVLPWHFWPVFRQREAAFLEMGGKFILPLPQVTVVGKNGYHGPI